MNYLLIVNSLAGKGIDQTTAQAIKAEMVKFGAVRDYLSQSAAQTRQIIEQQRDWFDSVVFVGGDGTFREGIRMLTQLKIEVPIGLIPMGTGNDFVKSIGVPRELSAGLQVINKGAPKIVHDCKLNESTFLNVASVGLDAAIVARQKQIKKRISGPLSYVVSTIIGIFKYKKTKQRLTIDGVDYGDDYMLVAVANGKYYGGGMKIAPQASPFERQFQIIALRSVPRIMMLLIFPLLYFGIHTKLDCVKTWHGEVVEIETPTAVEVNLDGDIEMAKKVVMAKNWQTCPKIYLSDLSDSH